MKNREFLSQKEYKELSKMINNKRLEIWHSSLFPIPGWLMEVSAK